MRIRHVGLLALLLVLVLLAAANWTTMMAPTEISLLVSRIVAPFGLILNTLRETGFRGALSLELFNRDYWQQDPLEVAQTGLAKMRDVVQRHVS